MVPFIYSLVTIFCICVHRIKHVYNFHFILFVSSGLGMCVRFNSLVCSDRINSQWQLRHLGNSGTQELLGKSWIQF